MARTGAPAVAPLTGTRVLDLTSRCGAYCSKVLADLGADVLKVERPAGDGCRSQPPFGSEGEGPEASLVFAYYHHNKRGITLDWERQAAVPLLAELATSSDVVLASPVGEPHRPVGFVDDPPSLAWVPPERLTCFITPYGVTGPCRGWRATPFTAFAMSGYMHPVGPPDGPPRAMPGQQFYDEAGVAAAFLIQAVLRGPHQVRDQVIDHAVHEVAFLNKLGTEQYGLSGQIKRRVTNFGPPPGGIWECRDGLVDIGAHSPRQWDIFVDVLGQPDTLTDPIYRERTIRIQLFDLLTDIIAELMSRRDARGFVEAGQRAGLPCALTHRGAEFVLESQARKRGFFVSSSRTGTGCFEIPGTPFVSQPPMASLRRSAPQLGEHNEEVFVDELRHSVEELNRWRSDGLV